MDGKIKEIIDPGLNVIRYEYDKNGNRTKTIDQKRNIHLIRYDATGRQIENQMPNGAVLKREYNKKGLIVREIGSLGEMKKYKYNELDRVSEITDELGNKSTLLYCGQQIESCSTGNCGQKTNNESLCNVIGPTGESINREYNKKGRLIKETDADGVYKEYDYDNYGRVKLERDTLGREKKYTYNYNGKLIQVEDAEGNITKYEYKDGRGNLTKVIDTQGNQWYYSYNLENKLLSEENPIGIITSFDYDLTGARKSKTDGNNHKTEYVYSDGYKLKEILYEDGTKRQYQYDERGFKTAEISEDVTIYYEYDNMGRKTKMINETLNKQISYEYDLSGKKTKMTGPEGEETKYKYNARGDVIKITDPDNDDYYFEYDESGRRTKMIYPNGITTYYGYTSAGRIKTITAMRTDGIVVMGLSYIYDKMGNLIKKIYENGGEEIYSYDALNRLIEVTYPDGKYGKYGYDAVGNRLWKEKDRVRTDYTYNEVNQLKAMKTGNDISTFEFDLNGNQISKTDNTEKTEYIYGLDDRLREVRLPGGLTNKFGYGANDLRVWVEDSNGRRNQLLDGINVLSEYNESDQQLAWYNHDPHLIDHYLSQKTEEGKYFYHQDHLGSVLKVTGQNAQIYNSYKYGVWGDMLDEQTNIQNNYFWTGRELNKDIDLQYNRARYYDYKTINWNKEDPLNMTNYENYRFNNTKYFYLFKELFKNPISLNRYQYTDNNPIISIDYTGNYKSKVPLSTVISNVVGLILAAIGAVLGALGATVLGILASAIGLLVSCTVGDPAGALLSIGLTRFAGNG